MIRRAALGLAAMGLAACGQPAPSASPNALEAPPEAARAYVGRWAHAPDLCANGAWVFERNEVATAGEVSCEFLDVEESGGVYVIEASCVAEAPPASYQIRLMVTQSGRAMQVSGGPWSAPIELQSCPAAP